MIARRFGLAVFDAKLFAVGGVDSSYLTLASVETLSEVKGTWGAEAKGLSMARWGCAHIARP